MRNKNEFSNWCNRWFLCVSGIEIYRTKIVGIVKKDGEEMVNTKLLPPAHFPTKEALRLWLLKHIEHPSIRRALEKGTMGVWGFQKPLLKTEGRPTLFIRCESPLGGVFHLNVVYFPNGLKIQSATTASFDRKLKQWLSPNRRSEDQGENNVPSNT